MQLNGWQSRLIQHSPERMPKKTKIEDIFSEIAFFVKDKRIIWMENSSEAETASIPLDGSLILLSTFVKQCSVKFRSLQFPVHDINRKIYSIYADNGVTYIVKGKPKTPPREKYTSVINLPGDETDNKELNKLMEELKSFTEEVNNLKIDDMQVEWGISNNKLPNLLSITASYTPNESLENYCGYLTEMCIFNALEIAQLPEAGKCFTGNRSCIGCNMNVNHQKVEIYRIRRFVETADYPASEEMCKYMRKRLSTLCPQVMMGSVPVCNECFKIYSKERVKVPPRSSDTDSVITTTSAITSRSVRSTQQSSRNITTAQTSRPMNRPKSPLFTAREADIYAATSRRNGLSQTTQLMRPKTAVLPPTKTPSGLTLTHNVASQTVKKAHHTYLAAPFPAFLQHD